ncbi:GDP-L-fucose synthase family protein [Trinickia acidisoli]|uniref:GDP-L-fucose synthase family protein n=1 Tax=Trinickia acidisoli TaxID=2767482 RepID=UPI001A8BF83E|nr:GDP-L-fucose synthase [Trinickia acidisoli]
MHATSRIYVAGHTGLIGSACVRRLRRVGFERLLLKPHHELELTESSAVDEFFDNSRPDYVVLAAGRVGGIVENQLYPADFINTNLAIQLNVLRAAHRAGVKKLILFGSSCMYPRDCPQPMPESLLLSGIPESTSLAYAVSKLAGVQMCLAYNQQYGEQRFIPLIPNSAFGPNDNFDPKSGHVLSALIRRFHEAKQRGAASVTLWGSGNPRREFIHADDVADACIALLQGDTEHLRFPINVGTGCDLSIRELAEAVASVTGYAGEIEWDTSKPDGAPRKLLDSSRIKGFGWRNSVEFDAGLQDTYRWYLQAMQNAEAKA